MKRFIFLSLLMFMWQVMSAQCTAPTITASGSTTLCSGGSVTLSAPAGNVWSRKSDYGGSLGKGAVGFSIGSKGYIGTGGDGGIFFESRYEEFWEYDPATNVWTQRANFGGGERRGAVGFSIGNKGYIGTGYNSNGYTKDFWEYNPANNAWTRKADFGGIAKVSATGFSIGNKGYIGTGDDHSNGYTKDFWEYNPANDAWTRKADFGGTAREFTTGFSIGNKGYIGTGYNLNGYTKDFWEYNPANDVWIRKADFGGTARERTVGFSIGSKGYIGVGIDGNYISIYNPNGNTKDFWEYNPANDAWTRKADFGGVGRDFGIGFSIASKGYIGAGISSSYTNDFWEYDPGYSYVWSPGGQTTSSISATTAGNYTVTTTNALGCSATSSATMITVSTPVTPVVTASGPTTFCTGGSVTLSTPAVDNTWTQKANFGGVEIVAGAGFSIGNKGYIGTGLNGNGSSRRDFWEYDPATNAWTQKANFGGSERFGATAFSIGSKGYIGVGSVGGAGGSKDLWEYNPTTNAWVQKADFGGTGRLYATGFSINGKGYIGTGTVLGPGGYFKDFWEYNPITDTWVQKADFGGTARHFATGFSISNRGYVGTGDDGSKRKDFWEYNPSSDTWIQKADFGGTGRTYPVGFSIGSKGYIGTGNDGNFRKDFWEYNPSSDTWVQKVDFSGTGRFAAVGFSIGSKGYIGTGQTGNGQKDFWEYDPGYTYAWAPGGQTTSSITVSTAGNYAVTTTNVFGCSATSAVTTVTVNTPVTPSVSILANSTNICSGTSVTFTATPTNGGTAPAYQWQKNGAAISGATNATYTTATLTNNDVISVVMNSNAACATPATVTSNSITIMVIENTGGVVYVDSSRASSGTGASWANAYKELREAVNAARQCSNITSILVAKGTYKPTGNTDRDSAFTILRGGLKIYGGYNASTGIRNITGNPTILSGNINTTAANDNSYHVLVLAGIGNSADSVVLDGFTISNGTAGGSGTKLYNGQNTDRSNGGGLYLLNNAAGSKIVIRNCSFTNNTGSNGGGVYNEASSPVFSSSNFVSNVAGSQGGAVYVYNYASPAFNNCFFSQNNAQDGGAIGVFFYSPYSVSNCVFVQNNASERGGALYVVNNSPATLTNCTLVQNNALYGGAMSFNASSNTSIINAIAWGNTATAYPLFFNNNAFVDVTYSLVQGGYTGTGNISSDPLFINSADPDGADNIFGTADDGLKLQAGSPAVNTGSNAAASGITTDVTGAARIQNGTVDMGAYEGNVCPSFTTLYVDSSIATSGNGSSWANAFKELSSAMAATGQCNSITAINVAKGTYKPTNDLNQDSTFAILRGGLKIYGGYPTGGGTRDIAANPTVLSGDLGVVGDAADNSYHIIVIANPGSNADSVVIDGFTITKATAKGTGTKPFNGTDVSRHDGGGVYAGGQVNSKTVIRNCTITANTAFNGGGLNSQGGSSPTLINCTFAGNSASFYGGGILNDNCLSFIKGCSFTGNSAFMGGGIRNSNSSVIVDSCIFSGNTGNDGGGGVQNDNSSPSFSKCAFINNANQNLSGGGMANNGGSPVVTNCTFIGNFSYMGGTAVSNQVSQALFRSCTFSANQGYAGSVISTYGTPPVVVTNSIIWGNTKLTFGSTPTISNPVIYNSGGANTTINYTDVQGGYTGTGNISSDPLFINSANAAGADNIFGTADDGLHLQAGSPAINSGSNAAVPAGVTTDITGAARIQDGTVDMGAYEGSVCPSFTTLYVDSSIASPGKGGSWATAFKTVQQALDAANSCSGIKQVWLKKGTYYPTAYPANCTDCAANGIARDYTFALRDGLALYGGFAGTETDTTQRVAGNITVLSGDIGTPNNNSDNCYHVLLAINSSNRLNGLTVTGGNANDNGAITVAGQTIYHSNGGGMYQYATSSALYNCTFTGNTASSEGGGMYNVYGSALRIRNSRYLNNHSGSGGAIRLLYGNTSFVSVNSVYSGNTASSNDAGALSLVMGSGTDTLINNAFIKNVASGNAANNGGGAIVQESGSSSYIVNNTFYADSAASNGGAIWFKSGGSNRYVYNNIFYKSYNGTASTDISMDGITTITSQSNNLYSNTNPLFSNELNPAGADNIFGTADDGLALQSCSPAVNGGSNVAGNQPADIAGQLRIFNGTTDIGAYEYQAIAEGSSLALNGDNGSYNIQAGVNALLIPGCRIIAHLLPNGANPLSGTLSAKIWIDNTQPVYGGKTFVKRHYELTPVANAATASARITLYATQDEFNAFNSTPYNGSNLPTGPGDFGGIANLRIVKFSGQSSNGTGLPGTYSQAGMEIDPDDNNIVWNNLLSRWEISFNVTGFSGFFISNNSGILPLTLLQFNGKGINDKDALLTWRTANEINTSHFELQRSSDGRRFTTVATLQAKGTAQSETEYNYTDRNLEAGVYYYRLQMVDKDGKETYSAVVTVTLKTSGTISLYPVPAKDVLWLSGSTANLLGKQALLIDVQGRVIQTIRISQWPQRIDILNLAPGTYLIKTDGEKGLPFIKQ